MGLRKTEYIAAAIAIGLHLAAVCLILLFAKPASAPAKEKALSIPVSLVTPQISPNTKIPQSASKPVFERKRRRKRYRRIPSKNKNRKKTTREPEKKMEVVKDNSIDCSIFDDTSCAPCLADAATCRKCCGKKDSVGAEKTSAPENKPVTEAPCTGRGCVKGDPCTNEALSRMSSSFCPKVRRAVYAKVGKTVLRGVGQGTFLSARIAIAISPSGALRLASILKSSGNSTFDSAVKKAVSAATRVLPPASLSACVTSRGCVFSVTIGAKKVTKTKSTVKISSMETQPPTKHGAMSSAMDTTK